MILSLTPTDAGAGILGVAQAGVVAQLEREKEEETKHAWSWAPRHAQPAGLVVLAQVEWA